MRAMSRYGNPYVAEKEGKYPPGYVPFDAMKAEALLAELRTGSTITAATRKVGIDNNIAALWSAADDAFEQEFAKAVAVSHDAMADSLVDIPDSYDIAWKAKLKSENIRWLLARLRPERYGERLSLQVSTDADFGNALIEAKRRRACLGRDQIDIGVDESPVLTTTYEELPRNGQEPGHAPDLADLLA